MRAILTLLTAFFLTPMAALHAADAHLPASFKSKLQTTLTQHLNNLLNDDGSIAEIKGKTSEGNGALVFQLMFEVTGDPKYRKAAVTLADQVLKDMRAMKHGVLPIKEKEKPGGTTIIGGGHMDAGVKIMTTALDHFPIGNAGQDGAHAAEASALILSGF